MYLFDLGIRRETKNRWERRAPLTPQHVEELVREQGRRVAVQPSAIRVFPDNEYRAAGAAVQEDLSGCRAILGIKEVPPAELLPGVPQLGFFHVIKGQEQNLPILRRALEVGATLIDYEAVKDRSGSRLLFFGRQAGQAGMIDALWTLGQRLKSEGLQTPLAGVRQTKDYERLGEVLDILSSEVGQEIREHGLPPEVHPLVVGITGGGNVAQGAQEVLDRLPVVDVQPEDLAELAEQKELSHRTLYKVVFRRDDRWHFERHLPHLTVLLNGIYWEPGGSRLVSWNDLAALCGRHSPPRLRVLADISCDIKGSIEATLETTNPGKPVYVVDPVERRLVGYGVEGRGPVVLAVENLPAELPRESSEYFGDALFPYLAALSAVNPKTEFVNLALPEALKNAIVVHQGLLTPKFRYLERYLQRPRS